MQASTDQTFQDQQTWQPKRYAEDAGYVAALGAAVLDMLAPMKGERILDLGCGDGVLSEKIAAVGADLLGVDYSADMIKAAKAKGLRAELADAQNLDFRTEFDAVFSNAALHWMPQPDKVVAGVCRSLKPGGRFVGEFGGHGNVAAIRVAVRAAFEMVTGSPMPPDRKYYPTADEYRAVLEKAGFEVISIEIIPRPTPLPTGLRGWYETLGGRFFGPLGADIREEVIEKAIGLARPELMDDSGNWTADYIRLRFKAVKKESV